MAKRRKIIPYNPQLKDLARELRKNMTLSEVLLWNELKQKNMLGYDFDRQRPIGNFIVDFFCKELSLAIEIDGDTHIFKYDYDEERQRSLEKLGIRFLRFEDIEVKKNMNNVLKVIEHWIEDNEPTPIPSREGNFEEELPSITSGEGSLKNKPTPTPSKEGNFKENLTSTPVEGNLNMKSTSDSAEGNLNRYLSTPVFIGSVPLGGNFPIRIQSMTNTDTLDTKASVAQCIRIIEAGADYVRLTAQGTREAENLAVIKKELRKAGYETPLIADIHFNPEAAETAARLVEKVRINPGNYADKRASFILSELSEKKYNEDLERIHAKLLPLIKICHENKTVIRVGINHGSLSDRIMTRYGNTPKGMVFSALEFIRIFRAENFNDLVLSMKSSDTSVMIEATRLLVKVMLDENVAYPLHLGVTEAGEGEDGRIRSAAGIGALLSEGIGDTIRVSLSEAPETEIPVARKIADFYPRGSSSENTEKLISFRTPSEKPAIFRKIPGPLVIANLTSLDVKDKDFYNYAGFKTDESSGETAKTDGSADLIITTNIPEKIPADFIIAVPYKVWLSSNNKGNCYPLFSPETYSASRVKSDTFNLLLTGSHFDPESIKYINPHTSLVIFRFTPANEKYAADHFLNIIHNNNLSFNIILNPVFSEDNLEDLQIKAASLLGRYINDRNISGISITNKKNISLPEINKLCFSILQSTGARITRTIYLSCPTCGRTKFNLQETVKKVKAATGHLKGLKIAVMGCIVNGPGEMAGADYGYVGAAAGKVHIYRGTVPVMKNIPEKKAIEELLKIIENDQTSL